MAVGIAITVVAGGAALVAYALIERRINQRACPYCGFRVSIDALIQKCPRCGHVAELEGQLADSTASGEASGLPQPPAQPYLTEEKTPVTQGAPAERRLNRATPANLPQGLRTSNFSTLLKIAIIGPALLLVAVDATLVIYRRTRPDALKAIWVVKGSSSPIENFTVEQYIDSTLYESQDKSSKIEIMGWRAEHRTGVEQSFRVEFGYTKDGVDHTAEWDVDLSAGKAVPANQDGRDLSWK